VCENKPTSPFIRRREGKYHNNDAGEELTKWPPFELEPDIKIYMYCTCAPCGDASMELCMASQEDATPWEVMQEKPSNTEETEGKMLDGRAHFSLLGVVRRKPARMDAESTRSKSCSDKLALRQVSSLLSCETSRLVAPTESAYLAGLILPEDEISRSGCERSFGENGRMKALAGRFWSGSSPGGDKAGYRFRPFQVLSVPAKQIESQWRFSKMKRDDSSLSADGSEESKPAAVSKKNRPSNVSAIWTAAPSYSHTCAALADTGSKSLPALNKTKTGLYENVINGVKQGNRATTPLARGASSLSRAKLWGLVRNVIQPSACHGPGPSQEELSKSGVDHVDHSSLGILQQHELQSTTYDEFKRAIGGSTDPNQVRVDAMNDAKAVLKGWVPNSGDENWGLDVLIDPQKRKR
jgi:tRNA-specific adenosine deaminase 1